jgi:orotate phosphoribosyltransferase
MTERLEIENRHTLFVDGEFISHSGKRLPFKIECDALTDDDLDTLAAAIARRVVKFGSVYGIPRGGVRIAAALRRYATGHSLDPVLVVDDVLTTGRSMEQAREQLIPNVVGAVLFARGPCPDWIIPLFYVMPEPAKEDTE